MRTESSSNCDFKFNKKGRGIPDRSPLEVANFVNSICLNKAGEKPEVQTENGTVFRQNRILQTSGLFKITAIKTSVHRGLTT